MQTFENIVIGGGASGLMFCAHLQDKSKTLLIEANSKLGAKIEISGGGACNFTNKVVRSNDYLGKKEFIEPILKEFNNRWLLKWFKDRGLEYRLKNGSQYFCKNSSKELLDILKNEIKGVKVILSTKVFEVSKKGDKFIINTNRGKFFSKRVIVASGGLSFPKLGASSIGYEVAKSFGHSVNTPKAALVGFTLQPQDAFFKELSGISVEVILRVEDKNIEGSLLFAHKGISGPAILNVSLFWNRGHIEIDFLPKFSFDTIKNSSKQISNLLPMPKRAAKAFLKKLEIKDSNANKLTKKEWEKLDFLKSYSFAPAGTFGFSKAEVTKGGVDVDEVTTRLMSKKIQNLFFLGEVLDVTGRLGGYNFQWAFATATKCAKEIENI